MKSISFILLSTSWGQSIAAILAIVGGVWILVNWAKWTVGDYKPGGKLKTESEKEDEILNRASKPGLIGNGLILMFSIMILIYILNLLFGVK